MIRLAVFLGNPGAEHERNRHNAGRLLLERFPPARDFSWRREFQGRFTQAGPPPAPWLLLPETYMNLSGRSVRAAAAYYKIPPAEILAVHDELELPLGTISLKAGGGLSGHNGLRSMKDALGSGEFWRLRIGVGRPPGRLPGEGGRPVKGKGEGGSGDVADWVLSDFTPAEEETLEAALDAGAALLSRLLAEEPETLLPEWKKKRAGEE